MRRRARRRSALVVGGLGALATATATVVHSTTLSEAVIAAYQTNPTLLAQRAAVRILDENYVQAKSALGVTISATAELDTVDARVDQPGSIFADASTLHAHGRTDSENLSAVQPLYTGGQGAAGISGAEEDIRAGRETLKSVEAQVIQQVITAYEDVLRDQAGVAIGEESVRQLTQERREAEARFREHEVTVTDQAQAEARLRAAEANLAVVTSRLATSRAEYVGVVGAEPTDLAPTADLPRLPRTLDDAFDQAARQNPRLLSALYSERASRVRVAQERAIGAASVSLQLDYSHGPVEPYDQRFFQQSFSGRLVVNKPIFTSGMNASRLRAALERNNRDRIAIDDNQRQSIQAVAQAWSQLVAVKAALKAEELQQTAEKIAYDSVRQELKAGLRTVIEVLNAQQELQNTRLEVSSAHHDLRVAQAALLVATGDLSAQTLAPDLSAYSPAASFRKVKDAGMAPWVGAVQALDAIGVRAASPIDPVRLEDSVRPAQSPSPDAPMATARPDH